MEEPPRARRRVEEDMRGGASFRVLISIKFQKWTDGAAMMVVIPPKHINSLEAPESKFHLYVWSKRTLHSQNTPVVLGHI